MLYTIDLVLHLVHAIRQMLLHSHLIHHAFQCLERFCQLLLINTKLLLESTIVFIYRAPLRFQLSNLGQ